MASSVWNVVMYEPKENDSILGVFSSNSVAQQFVKEYIENDLAYYKEDLEYFPNPEEKEQYLQEIEQYIFLETTPGKQWRNCLVTIVIEEYVIDDDTYYKWR